MKNIKYLFIGIKSIILFFIQFIKYFFIGLITIITILPYYIITGIKFLFSKKSKYQNQKIEKKFLSIIIITLSITTYLISIFIITRWYVQNERTKNFTKNLTNNQIILEQMEETENLTSNQYQDLNTNTENTTSTKPNYTPKKETATTNFININLNYYIQKNADTVAWLQLNGTKVNYPIVQTKDNDFYLTHDFYKRKTTNGWIFGDYRNNFESFNNNTVIYGHNLINDSMFGSIPNILKNNWYNNKNNHYIKLSTKKTNSIWKIFSVYKTDPLVDYLQTKFNSTNTYEKFLIKLKEKSIYKFDTELNYTDKIITLSTCDDSGTKRVVIHAKLTNIETK